VDPSTSLLSSELSSMVNLKLYKLSSKEEPIKTSKIVKVVQP
jgi:hypothetical protein